MGPAVRTGAQDQVSRLSPVSPEACVHGRAPACLGSQSPAARLCWQPGLEETTGATASQTVSVTRQGISPQVQRPVTSRGLKGLRGSATRTSPQHVNPQPNPACLVAAKPNNGESSYVIVSTVSSGCPDAFRGAGRLEAKVVGTSWHSAYGTHESAHLPPGTAAVLPAGVGMQVRATIYSET